jgi:anti-sigma regulatory factor (Ser/Thr protein kinase)
MSGGAERPIRTTQHVLIGGKNCVGGARDHAREFLRQSIPPLHAILLTDAVLAVSELVSNAVQHTAGPCTLALADDGCQVTITVGDTSTRPFTARAADPSGCAGGFGWHLLHRVSARMAVEPAPGGKRISVSIRRAATTLSSVYPGHTEPRVHG